jgi:prepilin-type N-terminal cleavage/methylation domain-containing protein/prepilin-type processing-associated H-X9-DG protein
MEPVNEKLRWQRSRAFTLVELAAVMAIVVALAALSYPVWMHFQRTAQSASCMQNMRQVGAGLVKYLGEHDASFPTLVMARWDKSEKSDAIDTVLASYVQDARVFACPGDRRRLYETTGTSYLWNTKLNGQRLGGLSVNYMKLDTIDSPSRIMVMADKEGFHPHLMNKINVLYADGHASQELTFVSDSDD